MIDLIQITNDPAFARRCDALEGMRLFVDLERQGKAARQAGRNTFISTHQIEDIAAVKAQLRSSRLMVRVNPINLGTRDEVQAVLDAGADLLMLPMFTCGAELEQFMDAVDGRAPVSALLETAGALDTLESWIATPGLSEVFLGLNDLHLSLRQRFMFESLAEGIVERVATAVHGYGIQFGFGGIARLGEGELPGRDVLAEHLRLGSQSVILSRTFHRNDSRFEDDVAALRTAEAQLRLRSPQQMEADAARIAATIGRIVSAAAASAG